MLGRHEGMSNSKTLSPEQAAKSLDRIAGQVDPDGKDRAIQAALQFLRAQLDRDFSGASTFFADDVVFNGLVMQVQGRDEASQGISGFLQSANVALDFDAVAHVERGATDRVLALYRFQVPGLPPMALCDHYTIQGGKITRIDNIFDASRLPPMGA